MTSQIIGVPRIASIAYLDCTGSCPIRRPMPAAPEESGLHENPHTI